MSLRALLSGESTNVPFSMTENLSTRFFASVGVPVRNLRPEQNLPLLRMALASAGHGPFKDDYELLQTAGELFEPEFERTMRGIERNGVKELMFRDRPKSAERMREKEKDTSERACCPASHTDVNAVMFFARNLAAFTRITEFFKPANNAHTAQFKEKSVAPDENGFPGNTVKFVLEMNIGSFKKVPFVTEAIILMDGCQKYYKQSHDSVNSKRGWDRWWSSDKSGVDLGVSIAASWIMGSKNPEKERMRLNAEMARATGLSDIRQTREFYMVQGTPVAHVTDPKGQSFCFVPEPETGFYRMENRFLTDGSLVPENKTSREIFLTAALLAVPEPDLSKAGKVPLKLVLAA